MHPSTICIAKDLGSDVPRQNSVEVPTKTAGPPVATPVRNALAKGGDLEGIPDKDDQTAAKPKVGQLRISSAAADQRMRRVMTPNSRTGEFKVSAQIVKMYKSKSGKLKLHQLFQSVGYDPESFVTEVELYRDDVLSNELSIEGEYASEEKMRDTWHWSEYPS